MIESLPYLLTGVGIIVSILYYTSVLRNANRTRELQLKAQEQATETRQAALFTPLFQFSATFAYVKGNNLGSSGSNTALPLAQARFLYLSRNGNQSSTRICFASSLMKVIRFFLLLVIFYNDL